MRELADAEQVRPPTMSRIVRGLERAGLARRRKSADKRRINLTATPKGVKLLGEAQKRRIDMLAAALSSLTRKDVHRIRELARLTERAIRSL